MLCCKVGNRTCVCYWVFLFIEYNFGNIRYLWWSCFWKSVNSVLQIYSVMSFTKIKKKKISVGEVSATHFLLLHTLLLQIIFSSRKILYIFRLQYKPKTSINRDYCVSGINCAAIKWNDAEINSHRFCIKWPKYLQDMCWITCFTNFHSPSRKPEVSARPFIYSLTNSYPTLANSS